MSIAKRGARVGVAVFALGVSLAGPHTIGTAAADPDESDTPSVSSGQTSSGPVGQPRTSGSRADQEGNAGSGAVRGRVIPAPAAAAAESAVPDAAELPDVRPARGRTAPRPLPEPILESAAGNDTPQTAAPSVSATVPAAVSNAGPAAGVPNPTPSVPSLQSVPAAAAAVAGPVPRGAAGSAAAVTTLPVTAPPPALAKPAAVIGAMITSAFDAAANWLAGLPNGPLTDFFEGALLLVRRTFFNLFPGLDVSRITTGQDVSDPSYFSQAELRDYLLGLAKQQYGDLYGQTVPVYGYGPYPEYYKATTDAARGSTTSDTNTQVNGVDEADFVETDGTYVYVARNNQLTIVRGDDLSVASQSSLSGNVVGQYLSGDRLTVISQSGNGWYGPMVKMAAGYYWGPWKPQTTVTIYDVSDRTAPVVVRQTTFDGDYQSSRAIDGTVYLVLQRSVNLPAPQYTETPVPPKGDPVPLDASADAALLKRPYPGDGPIAYRTYETWDSYVARVGDTIVDQSLPHAYSVDAEGNLVDLGLLAGAGDIVRPETNDQQSLATVVSIDSRGPAEAAFSDSVAAMVSGWGNTVYMNKNALYVATSQYRSTETSNSTDTRIDRFTVDGAKVGWQGTGVVSGTLINQFAMDEKDGYLRVATHTNGSQLVDGVWTNRNDSGVYVLDTSGKVLDQVGQVSGLAPGEQLYAVRYVGDIAYLVTFLQTDPLFVVDLSDPENPELQGELVVPGFSNYLQSVGDGLLLGIGQERENGNWNTHLQASLFNVADGTNPVQVDREYLDSGYQWSWSDAQFDHHALLYSAADGLLVVPVAASGYDPQTGYRYKQYLKVLRVGPAGLEEVGEIHPDEAAIRTVRIGDVLYAVGETTVTAYRLSDLSLIGTTAPAPAVV